MSQAGILDVESSNPQIPTSFVTNSGTAVPIGNTIEFLGNSSQGVSSSGSGNTITYTVANATTASKGVASFDPVDFTVVNGNVTFAGSGIGQTITGDSGGGLSPVAGNWNLVGAGSVTTSGTGNTLTTQLTGLTNHSLLVGAGTTTIGKLAVGTNGQVVIGATGSNPAFATLTSSDSSISFTTGANTLSLQVASGTTVGKTITGDSGGALSPTAGNWSLLGSGSITTSGTGSTLTTQLTGLTNHALLVGAGSTTITKVGPTATAGQVLQSAGSSADPAFSTATFPSTATGTGTILRANGTNWVATTATYPTTTTVSQLLYSSADNVVAGLATENDGVLITSHTGVPSLLANGTTGQVLTATTGAPPSWGAAAAGSVVKISTQTASNSASLTFTSGISATYTSYMVVMNGIVPATNSVGFYMEVSTDGGSNYISTNYQASYTFTTYSSATVFFNTSTSFFPLSNGGCPNSDPSVAGTLWLFDVTNGKTFKMAGNVFIYQSLAGTGTAGGYNTATNVNALRFKMSSGNITSGTISLYGIVP